MRDVKAKFCAAAGAALAVVAVVPATASAEPATHQVRYTLTTGGAAGFDVNYLTVAPPSKEAYNADPYAFVKKERLNLAPGAPWVYELTLEDPQWAIVTASAAAHGGQAPPNAHCEVAIDGQVVLQQDGPYTAFCQLANW